MSHSKPKRIMALIGVIVIITLFILTIAFLLMGNMALAITFVAVNGFVTIILFFTMRFHQYATSTDEVPEEDDLND